MNEWIEVAVPFPIHGTFTYSVPSALRGRAIPGVRVVVPFRNSQLIGVVVAPGEPREGKTKTVLDILDKAPLLSEHLLKLGIWMAARYMAPPGEALRVMLPPGLIKRATEPGATGKLWPVKRQLAIVDVERRNPQLPPRQIEAVERIRECRLPLVCSVFCRETGIGRQTLKVLEKKGIIRTDWVELQRSPWHDYQQIHAHRPVVRHALTEDQSRAVERINRVVDSNAFGSVLLHGVTGSGKTEVYLNCIEQTLARGRSALVLVPEIGLTPQAAHAFRGWFKDKVSILHSGLSAGERFDQWRGIQRGRSRVVVGTRSAIFAPLHRLGIIIVDEEHDGSYKQDETPRYHARETALQRAAMEGAAVVLGSATPQVETYFRASKKQHDLVELPRRVLHRPLPTVHVVDMRHEFQKRGRASVISVFLQDEITRRLEAGQQTLIFLNRRGYAPLLLCRSCGATETCVNCSISLTFHQRLHRLVCHYCGYGRSVPRTCHQCGKEYIHYLGEGTEKIQELLTKVFPAAKVDRLDFDTTRRKGSFDRILGKLSSGKTDILVGTQMIAKGHDFPGVTLVGVLSADQALRMADFRSAERTFQLMTQVAGRAGRGEEPGEVVVQTYYPRHYSLKYASAQDYAAFYRSEIPFRQRFRYPPFSILANIFVFSSDRTDARSRADRAADRLLHFRGIHSSPTRMRILGPAPAALERLKKEFRFHLLIKTVSRRELNEVLKHTLDDLGHPKRMLIDVDPISML